MKISNSYLIVAVVIGLGAVTAAPADDAKAVAADAAKFTFMGHEYDAKLARLAREAADEGRQMTVLCEPGFCSHCEKCAKDCPMGRPRDSESLREHCEHCGTCNSCKEYCQEIASPFKDLNKCDSGPCKNGGTCTNSDGSYSCKCQNGWTGINCNQDINECNSGPCKNEGTCTNSDGSYLCSCQDGWTGINCNQDINECNSGPCKNEGTCTNSDGSYLCSCQDGWTGNNCNQDINECNSHPCKNGGACSNSDGSYSCSCQDGWTGNDCTQVYMYGFNPK